MEAQYHCRYNSMGDFVFDMFEYIKVFYKWIAKLSHMFVPVESFI